MMENSNHTKNIPILIKEYEKYMHLGIKYSDMVLLEMIRNLNERILVLEHELLIKSLDKDEK